MRKAGRCAGACLHRTVTQQHQWEQQGVRHFDATLRLQRREISQRALDAVLLQHPFMTGKVLAGIHWQALKLWAKRATFYPHPSRRKVANENA